jgi:GntR family transcriptional repressor for pyruvate dehydrogenase complex
VIAEISHKMETAHANRSSGDEAWLDADFHMAIVKAHHIPRHGHAPA